MLTRPLPEDSGDILSALGAVRSRVKNKEPLIHHITNYVVANDSANAMLAVGALPVMAISTNEVEEMVSQAQALVINLGTPTTSLIESAVKAGQAANAHSLPVVLDPVGAGATRYRTDNALRVLREVRIGILRANTGEMASLLGHCSRMRGVEAGGKYHNVAELTIQASLTFGCVSVSTGAIDYVSDGKAMAMIHNGHPLLKRVTGAGCMVRSLCAAFAAVENDVFIASTAALAFFGIVAEKAALLGKGPGTFRSALFDTMFSLEESDFFKSLRVEVKNI